ncbi:MAG: hypothetical protein JSS13_06280 [Proteobacteria bacterium]|nr:hypothetical protein [Pseudomonadota bacterium]HRG71690.1 hypothetical protein [Thauera aminoaromatica]
MDRQGMTRCLEQVAAYRASGQKASQWASANGVSLRALSSWCAHARRWQAQLDGVVYEPAPARRCASGGFVAAEVAAAKASTAAAIRVELRTGATSVQLHWPLAHTRELAECLRELGR